jgi:hypothetical protein
MGMKRAQITVFIILAISIVIILFLLYTGREEIVSIFTGETPVEQIKLCIEESVQEGINIISVQGGNVNPQNFYLYEGKKIDYVCYTEENYKRCVMQKPLLKNDVENAIKEYSEPKIRDCLESIKSSLEKEGYTVTMTLPEVSVELIPENVVVNIATDLTISKDTTEAYKSIKMNLDSRLYSFVMIATSIANWEAQYGDSETINYMMYYPAFKVEKKIQSDGTRIYILTDRESLERFMFATRSVAFPSGIFGA